MKLLFVCSHNRCRSILSEAIANKLGQGKILAKSCGSHPSGKVHPDTIHFLEKAGYNFENLKSKSFDDVKDFTPDLVITVCDQASKEPCPIIYNKSIKINWSLEDPSVQIASSLEKEQAFVNTISIIEKRVKYILKCISKGQSAEQISNNILQQIQNKIMPSLDYTKLTSLIKNKQPLMYFNSKITNTERKKPKILLLYGSLRKDSYSYLVTKEAQLILNYLGAETKIFNPHDLPVFNKDISIHPEVQKLRELMKWSDGQVWCSPEQHGSMTSVFKNQMDWIPLNIGGVRPTQGKTLALIQITGGSQSFNTLNQMRILGRWMRMFTIPNQSSIEKAFLKFDQNRMTLTPFYNRLVDVMEELMKFTILLSQHKEFLTDRYSERVESVERLSLRVNQEKI